MIGATVGSNYFIDHRRSPNMLPSQSLGDMEPPAACSAPLPAHQLSPLEQDVDDELAGTRWNTAVCTSSVLKQAIVLSSIHNSGEYGALCSFAQYLQQTQKFSYRTVIYCRLVHSLLYQNSLLLCWIPKTARLRRDLLNTGLVHASKAVKIFLRRLHLVPASLVTDAGTAAELTIFLSELQTAPYPPSSCSTTRQNTELVHTAVFLRRPRLVRVATADGPAAELSKLRAAPYPRVTDWVAC